ncbi:MAG: TetR/AcrR family transcriptional regulator [Spirochaetes bacterium]|nr:TetR/AcrR family transcriptional regulator [Spirochaetota bacterium]
MPKLVDHDEYRRELLQKCFAIFCRKGYANVTMRELAAEIGVSTGTLYHYFTSKENIMEQMFEYVQETNVYEFVSRTEHLTTIVEKLNVFVEKWKEYGEFYQNLMLLAIDMMRNMKSRDTEPVFIKFSNYYTDAMARELKIPQKHARSLFIYLLGMILHTMLTPNFLKYDEQVDILREIAEKVLPLYSEMPLASNVSELNSPSSPQKENYQR